MRDAIRRAAPRSTGLLPGVVLLALLVSAVGRADPNSAVPAAAVAPAPSSRSPEHRLAEAIRFRTLSHQEAAQLDPAPFRALHAYLERAFPRAHAALARETVSELSLLYHWEGSEPSLPPVLLTAHLDVVPVPEDARAAWTHPPFEGVIADGYVWGRGALDDKVGVVGILEAVEGLLAEGFAPRRSVYLAFGHDEEVGGPDGAGAITDLLAERGVRLAFSLDEGMAIIDGSMLGIGPPVAAVGIAEKGYLTLRLRCSGPSGHSSTPPPRSSLTCLARAIVRLQENPFPARLEGVPGLTLDAVAPHLAWPTRLAVQARSLLAPLLIRQLETSPGTNALIRTTTAVTMAEAGVKENVLPRHASAVVNFRLAPGDDSVSVRRRVASLLEDLPLEIETLRAIEPSDLSASDGAAWEVIAGAIERVAPEAVIAPGLVLGGTDSKHYARIAEASYRFAPYRLGPEDLERIHGVDERIAVGNYHEVVRFFREVVRSSQELPGGG